MATTKKTTEEPAEEPPVEQTEETLTAETQESEEQPPDVSETEAGTYVLPPTLSEAGLVGVVGTTAGQYTVPSGSYFYVSPGQAYTVSAEDAAALVEQGVAMPIEDVTPPT